MVNAEAPAEAAKKESIYYRYLSMYIYMLYIYYMPDVPVPLLLSNKAHLLVILHEANKSELADNN
jgi:hypothetical protein